MEPQAEGARLPIGFASNQSLCEVLYRPSGDVHYQVDLLACDVEMWSKAQCVNSAMNDSKAMLTAPDLNLIEANYLKSLRVKFR
jgi:hypothetical protein